MSAPAEAVARPRRRRAGNRRPAGRRNVPRPELTVVETRVYRGPNYWSYDPAIKLVVDLGVLEHFPSNTIPGFTEALLEMLPGVGQHTCGTGRVGGFEDRLRDGTWVGHVAEHIALQLQREAGTEVGRGKTRGTGEPGRYHVVYSFAEEAVGLAAGKLAVRLVNHLVEAEPGFDFGAQLEHLILLAERAAFGPSTQAILDEAALRDIPSIRLNDQSLVQLGHGIHQTAHPRHDDQPDRLARRGHRRRQEADEPAAGRDRRAGAPRRGRPRRRRGGRRPRGASACRWRSSRSTATTAAASC